MSLYIKPVHGKGRGVFSTTKIKKGEIIEICPVVTLPPREVPHLVNTDLDRYYYEWGKNFKAAALPLGFGALYNHSHAPNAFYKRNAKKKIIYYVCLKNILAHQEITVNYNGSPKDQTPFPF